MKEALVTIAAIAALVATHLRAFDAGAAHESGNTKRLLSEASLDHQKLVVKMNEECALTAKKAKIVGCDYCMGKILGALGIELVPEQSQESY